jgi:hypothetical protein
MQDIFLKIKNFFDWPAIPSAKSITILGHQGWADFFTQNAIYRHYSNIYERVTIFVLDQDRKKLLETVFRDIPRIKILVPQLIDIKSKYFINYIKRETCIVCHTNIGGFVCPRDNSSSCIYPSYKGYEKHLNVKLSAFRNYDCWSRFLNQNKNRSFAENMYIYEKLQPSERIAGFKVSRDFLGEQRMFETLMPNEPYVVVHQDEGRGFHIDERYLPLCRRIYINNISKVMVDMIPILENAKEIHLIDSSYSVMVYHLAFKNNKIAKINKYLYSLNRAERDIKIYEHPNAPNWHLVS